jgi:hypothetical protein
VGFSGAFSSSLRASALKTGKLSAGREYVTKAVAY